jgi:hypothetical protein
MSVVFGGRVMKRLIENTEKVGASKAKVYHPRPSKDVAVREETIRNIISNQYNMIKGATRLIFSDTFKPEYYVPSDEDNQKELQDRLRVKFDKENNWADMSNKEEFAPVISDLNKDGILLTRDSANNNIIRLTIQEGSTKIPGEGGKSLLAKAKLGKLEVQYDSRFLRVNPAKNVLYFNGTPGLALEVEFDKSGKSFIGIPSFAIRLETDERGIEKYSICHLGYYNVDVMMKKGLEKTIGLIGYFGEAMPTVKEMTDRYLSAGGKEFSRSVQIMFIERFLNNLGVTLSKDLKGMLNTAMSSGSYKFIEEVPEGETEKKRVKIFTDMLVREAIEKHIKSKEVLFTEFLLNYELVAKALKNNDYLVQKLSESREEGSNKFDWVIPLDDRQKQVLSTFVEACRVAKESGFDNGLLTLSKLDDKESSSAQEGEEANSLARIRSELKEGRSVEEIVNSRFAEFQEGLSKCLPSAESLCNRVASKFKSRLYNFVQVIKSGYHEGLILPTFISHYVSSMNSVFVTSLLENSYALDNHEPVLKNKDVEIGRLIAEAMDVRSKAVKLANLYYNESYKILSDIGFIQYQKMIDKFADKSQQTQTIPFQERGYGAVDAKSNPYDKLEESENAKTEYKIEQDADGKQFVMVDGKKIEITPDQAVALQSLPSAEVDGVTELPNSAKDLNKSANRKRRKQKEEAVGDE